MRHPSAKPFGPKSKDRGCRTHRGRSGVLGGLPSRRHIPTTIPSPRGHVLPPLFPRQLTPISSAFAPQILSFILLSEHENRPPGAGQMVQRKRAFGTPRENVDSRVPSLAKSASAIQTHSIESSGGCPFGTVRLLPTATDEARLVVSFL
ncbi:hypothetical protein B0T14DRAFT_332244 [Immersiella caudata]|uniref:Uncharacterized protein n=1 Tax=Immersiella caudata TaxID=314043 RepID=A0AA39TSX5_9PEZI|nr:hypothetical protein B0T14DRAFT_332244 [Immersiella caudata]